jgi:lysine 2,3-aminomutase
MSPRDGTPWASVPDHDWDAWQWQMTHRVRTEAELAAVLCLTDSERDAMRDAATRLRTDITPYFATLLSREDATCPLRRQVVPQRQELQVLAHESADPLAEDDHSPVPGLVHRYPDRVALFTTSQCASYCRFCTRSRIVGKPFRQAGPAGLRPAFDYIARHPEVRDVLLTGGDPLLLADDGLDAVLAEVRAIPHVEIVRINTRIPIFLPQRIDVALVDTLKRHHPLWINVHVNHPKELAPEARAALTRLADAGIPLGSQSLLMAGVNDCPNVFRALVHQLAALRVRPYYLYQCDPVLGSSAFVAPVEKGLEIIAALRGHTSGLCVPVFVIDAPGGGGKVALQPNALVSHSTDRVLIRTYQGDEVSYHQPGQYEPHAAAACGYCTAATLSRAGAAIQA